MSQVIYSVFLSPNSIFFVPFLASGIFISLVWLVFSRKKTFRQSLLILVSPDAWLTKDAALELFLSLFFLVVLSKTVDSLQGFIFGEFTQLERWVGPPSQKLFAFRLPPLVEAMLATAVSMLAYDFASYAMHRSMHRNSLLWRIHEFHHSAPGLTFFTTYRQHPLEPLLLAAARAVAANASLGVFHCLFPAQTPVVTVLGLGAGFFAYMFTVNLHHSPVPVSYPHFLRTFLISPHVHHLHHSAASHHLGKNYGVVFSLWDRWLGTYHDEKVELGQLTFLADAAARNNFHSPEVSSTADLP